jgi:hypothetical protein
LHGVIDIKPTSDKASLMQGQTPKLESGSLFLPKSAPWLDDFFAEYLTASGAAKRVPDSRIFWHLPLSETKSGRAKASLDSQFLTSVLGLR